MSGMFIPMDIVWRHMFDTMPGGYLGHKLGAGVPLSLLIPTL